MAIAQVVARRGAAVIGLQFLCDFDTVCLGAK
jgi:hypothetical protein